MTRLALLALAWAGCSPATDTGGTSSAADLVISLEPDAVAVGGTLRVVVSGTLEAPVDTAATVSVAAQAAGGGAGAPEVVFQTVSATPADVAELLDGSDSADNQSAGVRFTLVDGVEEVEVTWDVACDTAGAWEMFAAVGMEAVDGAVLAPDVHLRARPFTCE